MPTTSRGYTYPASTSHTRLWEHIQTLAQNVNDDVAGILTNYFPATVQDRQDTGITGITGTSYAAGTTCGKAFIASTTGRALIHWKAQLDNTTSDTLVSIRVGSGATLGSGTEVFAAADAVALSMTQDDQLQIGMSYLIEGLTPGATYNAVTMHRVTTGGGTGAVSRRAIIIAPAT